MKFFMLPTVSEPTRLLLLKKVTSLPVFSPTHRNGKKKYPARALARFEEKFQPTILLEPPLVLET